MRKNQPDSGPFDNTHFAVTWTDLERWPTVPANPEYPNGVAIDVGLDALAACRVELPYPAARCGFYRARCLRCGFAIVLTTAGRPDDPRTVRVPCKLY